MGIFSYKLSVRLAHRAHLILPRVPEVSVVWTPPIFMDVRRPRSKPVSEVCALAHGGWLRDKHVTKVRSVSPERGLCRG